MKKIFTAITLCFCAMLHAQQFINTGMVEFEVRVNNHKSMGEGMWAEMFKDKVPQFSTYYYHYIFNDNKAVYKFDHKDEKTKMPWENGNDEDNIWYNDY